jgi:YVTN family beta-propeller protein
MKKLSFLFLIFWAQLSLGQVLIAPPAGKLPTQIDKTGTTVIPNGRFIKPLGHQITVAPHPYGMILSPDGKTIVTANSGTSPLSITIIRNFQSDDPEVQQIPPGTDTQRGVLASVFMGLAISPDNKIVYVAGGQENKIYKFDLNTGAPLGFIDCTSGEYTHGYIGDMKMSKDGTMLYAVDQIGFRMVAIDLVAEKVAYNVSVGRYPFGITLSPDEQKVYVANVGMYEYKPLESLDPDDLPGTALTFPAFGYQTKESKEGIYTDEVKIPGLGEINGPESFSVWAIDISKAGKPVVNAKVKTGILIGEKIEDIPAVGGSSPNSLVATDEYVFVSNGNNDCVSVIDVKKNEVVSNIFLNPEPRMKNLRGVIPFGLALSPDQQRLYIAEAGINAVAVVDIPSKRVLGHLPVGWFPAKLAVSKDGKQLIVTNAKGFGSGPNGGRDFQPGPEGSNIGRLMKGTVSIVDIPDDDQLDDYTKKVNENNFTFKEITKAQKKARKKHPIPLFTKQKKSPIKYWVFIAKENRTYDEIFGQLDYANGDETLARYGRDINSIKNRSNTLNVENVTVMPNHLALAEQFAIADNFYCDADHSADGHRWLVGTYPNEWVETSTSASYGRNRNMRAGSKAPGNWAMTGSSSAIYPEDYNEAGSIWDHFERNKISYYNFGLGLGLAARLNSRDYKPLSVKYTVNYPLPAKLIENSSREFPVYNTAIPDQYRANIFIKEVEEKWVKKGKKLPSVIIARIPNDHGAGERPDDGYPLRESYMADNDLAIGRVVEYLSHTKYWKNMAIIITEDDSQGGVDHVDAHRSILMVISPYAKKRYAGSVHYSFGSIFKTFWHSLRTPYLNQYDAGATDLSDLFTDVPDYTPYNAKPVDVRIFDPQKALTPIDEKFNWEALEENSDMDHPAQMLKDSQEFDQKLKTKKKKNGN